MTKSKFAVPLGGHFLWPEPAIDPVLLIGGGSSLVPLMAMIRQRRASRQAVPTALLLSARTAQGRYLLRRTSLHRNQRSGVRPGARDYARETGSRIGLCATDRRHDRPRNSNQAQGKPTQVFVCGYNGSSTSQPIARCWRAWTPPSSRRSATGASGAELSHVAPIVDVRPGKLWRST